MDTLEHRRHKLNNALQSLLIVAGMAGLLALLGWLIAGTEGVIWAVVAAAVAVVLGPRVSPGLVLRLYRARPIAPWQAPQLYAVTEALARRAGIADPPRLFYVPTRLLNAFAVGTREEAAIAVTDGLLRALNTRELAGVLAHEISHIRHNDMWVMGLADVFSRLTLLMSQGGLLLMLLLLPAALVGGVEVSLAAVFLLLAAPTVSTLLQLGLSRTREHDADLGAVELTGDPRGLASALDKLERYQGGWFERIFMPGRRLPEPAWLRTHPPTEERIRRLLSLEPRRLPNRRALVLPPQLIDMGAFPGARRPLRWHFWSGTWR